jgi:hypothetical protein
VWVFRKGRAEITCLIWVKGPIVGPDFTLVMLRGWVYSSYTWRVLLVCDQCGLIERKMFAIDGCKLPSNASKEWSGTHEELARKSKKSTVLTVLAQNSCRQMVFLN